MSDPLSEAEWLRETKGFSETVGAANARQAFLADPNVLPSSFGLCYRREEDIDRVPRYPTDRDGRSAVRPHREGRLTDSGRPDVVPEVRPDVDRARAPIGRHRADPHRSSETLTTIVRANDLRVDERMSRPDAPQQASKPDIAVGSVGCCLLQAFVVDDVDGAFGTDGHDGPEALDARRRHGARDRFRGAPGCTSVVREAQEDVDAEPGLHQRLPELPVAGTEPAIDFGELQVAPPSSEKLRKTLMETRFCAVLGADVGTLALGKTTRTRPSASPWLSTAIRG